MLFIAIIVLYSCKYCNGHEKRGILPAYLPEISMTAEEMMKYRGYEVEKHNVTTDDGYIITVHRIPKSRDGRVANQKYPVLLAHGLECSSAEFTNGQPNESLGYMLADNGYDVWMINFRGNIYSRSHIKWSPSNAQFWEFSWDEMGMNDLPAVINHILEIQNQTQQLFLVSYSMGSMAAFSLLSTNVAFNDKIKSHVALGPVTYVTNVRGILPYFQEVFKGMLKMGIGELLPQSGMQKIIASTICNGPLGWICETVIGLITGDKPQTLNSDRFAVYIANFPAGSSTYAMVNIIQDYKLQRFASYDWGKEKNLQRYGQETPREYNISKITSATHIFHAKNDYFSNEEDLKALKSSLQNLLGTHLVGNDNNGHMSLVWGSQLSASINKQIIEILNNATYT